MSPYYVDDSVTLYAGDCLDVLRTLPDCSVDSVVTDPPYNLSFMGKGWDTFSIRKRAGGGASIHHEMKSAADHIALADALRETTACVVLSGYPSDLYADLYSDWHRTDLATWTGQGNAGPRDGARTEVLWSTVTLDTHPVLDFGAVS